MFHVLTCGFAEMAEYAYDRSRKLHGYAAAMEIVNCLDGHTRRLIVVQPDPIAIQTDRYEVVLRARLYRDGTLSLDAGPGRN